jgi:tetratricopeptide (TPR) repeat protein
VADDERKGKAHERDEDEAETSASDEESSEETEGSAGESEGEGEGEAHAGEGGEGAAERVADALGVGVAPAEAEPEEKADDAPAPNRAARRQEAALRRKKRKAAAPKEEGAEEEPADEPLPKDKNARAKELLKRRREQASEGTKPIQLLPGEMVDDALARSTSAIGKWIRANFGVIQWVIVGGLVAVGGYMFYLSQAEARAASASDALAAGILADRGRVMAEDKRSDEEKEIDPNKVYKSVDERADSALSGYKKVVAEHPSTGAAILGRLGEGGAYLDKHDWDHALEAFSAVASSSLAGADHDVKARATEGLGFTKEGKGDLDGAMAAFKDLQAIDGRGNKELGMYHEARILLAKGDKDKAKDLLKQVHDKLEQPTTEGTFHYLKQVTDETLRRIDPSLVPAKTPVIGGPKGSAMTKEQIEKLIRMKREAMEKKTEEHH